MSDQVESQTNQFNVLTWNMLVSKTKQGKGLVYPQRVRLPAHIKTLQNFNGSLDVVGIQEATMEDGINCGVALAAALGFPTSFFYRHNRPPLLARKKGRRGRKHEYIGLFGALVTEATPIHLGDRRIAVKTMVGSTAVVNFHLRQGRENREIRVKQMRKILASVADCKQVALIGDTNENPTSPARLEMHGAGFESAHVLKYGKRPKTFPTPEYHEVMYTDEAGELKSRVSIDDISVRGLTVVDAGIVSQSCLELPKWYEDEVSRTQVPATPADHELLWTTLQAAA